MEFKVEFKSEKEFSTEIPSRVVNSTDVKKIKEITNAGIDAIDGIVYGVAKNNVISTVDWDIIEKCPHFKKTNYVVVMTPPKYLNKFIVDEIDSYFNYDEGHTRFYVKRKINGCLNAWKEAGYPLRWGFEDDED